MGFRLCSKHPLTWGVWNKRVLQPSAGNSKDYRACQTQGTLESQVILEADMVIIVNSTLYLSLLLCSNPLVSPPPHPLEPLYFFQVLCVCLQLWYSAVTKCTVTSYSDAVDVSGIDPCTEIRISERMYRDWTDACYKLRIKAPQWKEIKNVKSSNDWTTPTLHQPLVSTR